MLKQHYNLKNIRDTISIELLEDVTKFIFIFHGHFISITAGVQPLLGVT
jgi:hypothetical protein